MKNIIITTTLAFVATFNAFAQDAIIVSGARSSFKNTPVDWGASIAALGGHLGASLGYFNMNETNLNRDAIGGSLLFCLNKKQTTQNLNDWVSIGIIGYQYEHNTRYGGQVGYMRMFNRISVSANLMFFHKDYLNNPSSTNDSNTTLSLDNKSLTFTIGFNILGNPPQKAGCWTLY